MTRPSADMAVSQLFDTHGDRIYRLALGMCGNPEDAEDLVQETFLLAFRRWSQFEGRADPGTWLYTIASRACWRMHRRRAGQPRHMMSLSSPQFRDQKRTPEIAAPGESAQDALEREEASQAVQAALAKLPVHFRLPFVLKELVDFSISEIAAVLGLKEATVRTRIHRARLLMRQALSERDSEHPSAGVSQHPERVCLDLLRSKQLALDRGVTFPLPDAHLCSRCRTLFASLDLVQHACADLKRGVLPERLRATLRQELESPPISR